MKGTVHLVAGVLATLLIATFWLSTVLVELFGSVEALAMVKRLIVMPGLFILVPAIAATGGSGFALSRGRAGRLVDAKKKRMPFIAANGLLVLVPCAIFLNLWAASGAFDARFYLVQGLELVAGATNLVLMGMNIRDGLRFAGRRGLRHDARRATLQFRCAPAKATLLHSIEIPVRGGNTCFSNSAAVYRALPEDLKRRLDGLCAEFVYVHPVIVRHPATGEPGIYVNPYTKQRILGMPEAQSDTLIERLADELESMA